MLRAVLWYYGSCPGFACMNAAFSPLARWKGSYLWQLEAAPSHTIITSGMEQVRRTNECELLVHGAFQIDPTTNLS